MNCHTASFLALSAHGVKTPRLDSSRNTGMKPLRAPSALPVMKLASMPPCLRVTSPPKARNRPALAGWPSRGCTTWVFVLRWHRGVWTPVYSRRALIGQSFSLTTTTSCKAKRTPRDHVTEHWKGIDTMTLSAYADSFGRYPDFAAVRAANAARGGTWFTAEAPGLSGDSIETELIGGRYWVESSAEAALRVVTIDPEGAELYLSGGDTFADIAAARAYIATIIT